MSYMYLGCASIDQQLDSPKCYKHWEKIKTKEASVVWIAFYSMDFNVSSIEFRIQMHIKCCLTIELSDCRTVRLAVGSYVMGGGGV